MDEGCIWEYWARDGQAARVTCAVIVTQANELMARIHDRMPAIIAPEDYSRWLDPARADQGEIARMLAPYPAELMRAYAVSPHVNDARNDDTHVLEPVADGALL